MAAVRKIIQIDEEKCNGCGNCVVSCDEGAIEIRNGKAVVMKDSLCDGLGACMGDCPMDALKIIEREADAFDEVEVERHLASMKGGDAPSSVKDSGTEISAKDDNETLACGCPSTEVQEFCTIQETGGGKPDLSSIQGIQIEGAQIQKPLISQLTNFPFQIKLVPPEAPFFQNADLVIIADCVAYCHANAHETFIKGKKLLIGCPKLDERELNIQRLSDILRVNEIKSLTLVHLEIPCCSNFKTILEEAIKRSGKIMGYRRIVINTKGDIIDGF